MSRVVRQSSAQDLIFVVRKLITKFFCCQTNCFSHKGMEIVRILVWICGELINQVLGINRVKRKL